MSHDEVLRSPDTLLRHAAAADAGAARSMLARISATRLLDLVVTQAELAVDEDRPRPAGIDAVGDLARTAIEVMELPQGVDLEFEDEGPADGLEPPTVTGWELVTVEPAELAAATLALPVRPWMLALVAFEDAPSGDATSRRVVAAAADGRVATALLRVGDLEDDGDVLAASVGRDPDDLGEDAPLAHALLACLQTAARGG